MTQKNYMTIAELAEELGVTGAAVRSWITKGLVEEPIQLPVTNQRAYPAEHCRRIVAWYRQRAACGGTRGPGSQARREAALTTRTEQRDTPGRET